MALQRISKHTGNIFGLRCGAFASQTILRPFVQIYSFGTVSSRCYAKNVNACIDRVKLISKRQVLITWGITGLVWSVSDPKTILGSAI